MIGVAPHWFTIMKKIMRIHTFYRMTRMHLLSQQDRCNFSRLKKIIGTMMKKKSTMRKAKAVPVRRFRGNIMSRGK
jgi:hypothetical protein